MNEFLSKIKNDIYSRILRLPINNKEKIFGIGLSRTGTTSLNTALRLIGYKSFHMPPIFAESQDNSLILKWHWWLNKYDAYTDIPVTYFFSELDRKFPNSKFIQTVRDKDAWLESCSYHFKCPATQNKWNLLYKSLYGAVSFNKDIFSKACDIQNSLIDNYFKNRPGCLLKINICAGEGWERLCPFLDKPIPSIPFPKENQRKK